MNMKLLGGLAALGLLLSGSANAVPCGDFGAAPSAQFRNGIGSQDSANALNDQRYFGANNWQFLDRADEISHRHNEWTVIGAGGGLPGGLFWLADGIWDSYDKLAVALTGPGAYPRGAPR